MILQTFRFLDAVRRTLAEDRRRARELAATGPAAPPRVPSAYPGLQSPVFVVGAPRSGTTFVGDCLARLTTVSYHHEPIAAKLWARDLHQNRLARSRAARMYRLLFRALLGWRQRSLRFVEKTPLHCFFIPFLAATFPGSRFLHLTRDGRDAALSLAEKPWFAQASACSGRMEPGGHRYGPYARFWVEPNRAAEFESASDLHRCIWTWRLHEEAAREGFARLPPSRILHLRYEEIMAGPRSAAEAILNFLDDPRAGGEPAFRAAMERASASSVGRWKTGCGPDELALMHREAGELLHELGYGS